MNDSPSRWVAIPGIPDCEASDSGQIRRNQIIVPGSHTPRGYRTVTLAGKSYLVHRLIARAFLGEPPPGNEVRHLNDVPDDNNLSNLAYGTHSENMRDRVRNGGDPQANQTHCHRGHPFDASNTYRKVGATGRTERHCRTCLRDYSRQWMRQKRASAKEAL